MAQTAREIFVVGLRNAHAMETQARELMERQSERLDEYPDVKTKLTAHLEETHEQLRRLEQCLESCGETTSALKDTAQSVMANAMAMTHAMAGDEILTHSPTTPSRILRLRPTNRCWRFADQLARTAHEGILRLRSGKRNRWPSGSLPMLRK
jgi:hypothetical protein